MEHRLIDRTTRRAILAGLATALARGAPVANAQPKARAPVLAIVTPATPVERLTEQNAPPALRAFFAELRRRGRVEGESLTIERYNAHGRAVDFPALAQSVVARKPDVMLVLTSDLVGVFGKATKSIPIVGYTGDPVSSGLVSNLARPGGNITGVSIDPGIQLASKRLEVLREALPNLARVGYLGGRTDWEHLEGVVLREAAQRTGIEIAAPLLGDQVDAAEYRRVFAALVQRGIGALMVSPSNQNVTNRSIILNFERSRRLPAVYPYREYAQDGGLFAYGPDQNELFSRAADEIDEILKGAKPGDIPYTLPTKLILVINLKTAAALGLTMPPTLLIRADEVIE